MIVIELSGRPQAKGRPRVTRNGIAFTPAKTRQYEAALRWAAQEAMAGRKPLETALRLDVGVWVPIPKGFNKTRRHAAERGFLRPITRPDFDNYLKCVDAFNGIVWADDSQVVVQTFSKYYGAPRFIACVSPFAPTPTEE